MPVCGDITIVVLIEDPFSHRKKTKLTLGTLTAHWVTDIDIPNYKPEKADHSIHVTQPPGQCGERFPFPWLQYHESPSMQATALSSSFKCLRDSLPLRHSSLLQSAKAGAEAALQCALEVGVSCGTQPAQLYMVVLFLHSMILVNTIILPSVFLDCEPTEATRSKLLMWREPRKARK